MRPLVFCSFFPFSRDTVPALRNADEQPQLWRRSRRLRLEPLCVKEVNLIEVANVLQFVLNKHVRDHKRVDLHSLRTRHTASLDKQQCDVTNFLRITCCTHEGMYERMGISQSPFEIDQHLEEEGAMMGGGARQLIVHVGVTVGALHLS